MPVNYRQGVNGWDFANKIIFLPPAFNNVVLALAQRLRRWPNIKKNIVSKYRVY